MNALKKPLAIGLWLALSTSAASAAVCDWRPSQFFGTATAAVTGGSAAAIGAGMKAAGFYTLVNAGSGLTMVGSTLAGASGAGTVGIIAGTGGSIGTVVAILMAPVTLVVGGGAALGGAVFEAACYFTDERITDYSEVLAIMQHLDEHHDPERFRLILGIPGREDDAIRIWNAATEELDRYLVSDLYLVNGRLWASRSWRLDQDLGMLLFIQPAD